MSTESYVNWVFSNPGTEWPGDQLVTHEFWLRHDFCIRVALPYDLTADEAHRLAEAIRTFPFEKK
jgi:hypothetical protein